MIESKSDFHCAHLRSLLVGRSVKCIYTHPKQILPIPSLTRRSPKSQKTEASRSLTLALANCQAKSIKLQGDLSHLYVMSRSQKARLDIVTQIKFIHKFSTRSSSVFAVESPRCIWTRQRPFHFPWFMWLCNSSIQNIGACVPAYWLLVPSWQCLDALQLKLNTRY